MRNIYSVEWTRNRYSDRVTREMMGPISRFFVEFSKNNKYTNRCIQVGENYITTVPSEYKRCDVDTVLNNYEECRAAVNSLYTIACEYDLWSLVNDIEMKYYLTWFSKLRRLYYRRFKNISLYQDIKCDMHDIMSQVVIWPVMFIPGNFFYNGNSFKIDIMAFHIMFKCYVQKCNFMLSTDPKYTWNNFEDFVNTNNNSLCFKSVII